MYINTSSSLSDSACNKNISITRNICTCISISVGHLAVFWHDPVRWATLPGRMYLLAPSAHGSQISPSTVPPAHLHRNNKVPNILRKKARRDTTVRMPPPHSETRSGVSCRGTSTNVLNVSVRIGIGIDVDLNLASDIPICIAFRTSMNIVDSICTTIRIVRIVESVSLLASAIV